MKLLIVDTETGGLNPKEHDLLTIGLVVWEDKEFKDELELKISKEAYRTTEQALAVNKLNLEELKKIGESEKETIAKIIAFVKKNFGKEKPTVCGHNVNFDVGFLRSLFERNFFDYEKYLSHRTLDTMSIMTFLFLQGKTETRLAKLDDAIQYFQMTITAEERHTALADTKVTGKILNEMLGL